MGFRTETDTMGTVSIPEDAYYGASTARAQENFPVSGVVFPPEFIHSLALIKKCAARANAELGELEPALAEAVIRAADEVMEGRLADQFVLDIFQTGSGTSTNMNMNEVLAARANEILTGTRTVKKGAIHPNDHVNRGQSSNDVIPTAIHVSAAVGISENLIPALKELQKALAAKASEFADIPKIGRTHLNDAVPIFLGDEFSGYARQVALGVERIEAALPRMLELALGGTAVGNGLNTKPEFARTAIGYISGETGLSFVEARNHFEAQAARDAAVETSGALKTVAVSLTKIANDLRWLASGPRCGLGEIRLPALQPGSSIMPGKVNPVIPESVVQVAAQVVGNDAAITLSGLSGNFELNVTLPVIAHNLLFSIKILGNVAKVFTSRCIEGIKADRQACARTIENSLAMATYLVPHVGYDMAAKVAKSAFETGRTVREVVASGEIVNQTLVDVLFSDSTGK